MKQTKDNSFVTSFIFPFKYRRREGGSITPDDVVNLLKIHTPVWKISKFLMQNPTEYSEYNYLHPFVRRAIFDTDEKNEMRYLIRDDFTHMKLKYGWINKDKIVDTRVIETTIESINLHLYDNQVALITIVTEGENIAFDDLLRYNDTARRVYPPYLDHLSKNEGRQGEKVDEEITKLLLENTNTAAPKLRSSLIPISVEFSGMSGIIREDFKSISLGNKKEFLSSIITRLLEPMTFDNSDISNRKASICYSSFIDDRMFIISFLADDSVSRKLSKRNAKGMYPDKSSDDWYRFVFVDGDSSPSIANKTMKKELLEKSSYLRWVDKGLLYGFSPYSFIILGTYKEYFHRVIVRQHAKTIYYQMALILIFQRAMLLKFAEDVDRMTQRFSNESMNVRLHNDALELSQQFIKFVNKYLFIEVTPQQQGIEMYDKWLDIAEIPKLHIDVRRKITEMSEYIDDRNEAETNTQLRWLTQAGLPIILLGTILAFWGIYESEIKNPSGRTIISIVVLWWRSLNNSIPLIFATFFFAVVGLWLWWKGYCFCRKRPRIFTKTKISIWRMITSIKLKKRHIRPGNTSIICPSNDGESATIIDICRKLGFDLHISRQPWGATLEKEPSETFDNLKNNVVIVEIPGLQKEEELHKSHTVYVLDHHRYEHSDRSNHKSSLEQFAELIGYTLNHWEKGIALNDRGYIYALRTTGYGEEEIRKIREYDLQQQGYGENDIEHLKEDYSNGFSFVDKIFVVETISANNSYIADLFFFSNKCEDNKNGIFIITLEKKKVKKVSFNGSPEWVKKLYKQNGGYFGGDEQVSMYWGKIINSAMTRGDALKMLRKRPINVR